jgi:hypothetical protein
MCGAHSDSAHLDLAPERNAAVPECKIRSERGIKVWCGITLIRSERGIKVWCGITLVSRDVGA